MLNKTNTLSLIKRVLTEYNELISNKIDSKITPLETKTSGFSGTIKSYIDGLTYITSETISDAEISTLINTVKTTLNL